MERGRFWSLGGVLGDPDAPAASPFARLSRGEVVRLTLLNRTAFPHAMHLHGMHVREVAGDGTLGPLRDTLLSLPDRPLEVAFAASNPGKWLLHCHMLGHAASGMTNWIDVT